MGKTFHKAFALAKHFYNAKATMSLGQLKHPFARLFLILYVHRDNPSAEAASKEKVHGYNSADIASWKLAICNEMSHLSCAEQAYKVITIKTS